MINSAGVNNRRYDLSDRLIHFFRDLDIASDDAPMTPEYWGYSSITEDYKMSALFLLRHCIRQGRIWATWSFRGGVRTIYGHRPAVCFTEMPIAAFIETSRARKARGESIASCALVLPKRAAFVAGARPAIYALSRAASAPPDPVTKERIFVESILPIIEQYRFVAYDPSSGKLDWTHEREWRWPLDEDPWHDLDGLPPAESSEIPGLEIDAPQMQGIGVIVRSEEDAQRVVHDIVTKVDRGDVSEFHYQFVLAHENIQNWNLLRDNQEMENAIHDNIIDLAPYFSIKKNEAEATVAELDKLAADMEARTSKSNVGYSHEHGGCWLWVRNNRHSILRALTKVGRVKITKDGHYLVDFPMIDQRRPLRQRQEIITDLAKKLFEKYHVQSGYYSVLNSWDANAVPSYHDSDFSDSFFWNLNH